MDVNSCTLRTASVQSPSTSWVETCLTLKLSERYSIKCSNPMLKYQGIRTPQVKLEKNTLILKTTCIYILNREFIWETWKHDRGHPLVDACYTSMYDPIGSYIWTLAKTNHEDPSLDPQPSCRKTGTAACVCNLWAGGSASSSGSPQPPETLAPGNPTPFSDAFSLLLSRACIPMVVWRPTQSSKVLQRSYFIPPVLSVMERWNDGP